MKRLLLPLLAAIVLPTPVIAEVNTDVRLLCLRSQTAFDLSYRADNEDMHYTFKVWLPAANEEEKKFKERGEIFDEWSVVSEPYKSIQKEHRRLSNLRREKRHAYARTLVPILKLAGYERPEFYLWYYTSYMDEIRAKHNTINLTKVEEYAIGQDYFSHTGSGNDVRDELCKLYGYEFKNRYGDQEFKRKYNLKDW